MPRNNRNRQSKHKEQRGRDEDVDMTKPEKIPPEEEELANQGLRSTESASDSAKEEESTAGHDKIKITGVRGGNTVGTKQDLSS